MGIAARCRPLVATREPGAYNYCNGLHKAGLKYVLKKKIVFEYSFNLQQSARDKIRTDVLEAFALYT